MPLTAAQQALADANRHLALFAARVWAKRTGEPVDELEGEALLGLCKAALRYQPTRGRFEYYASVTMEGAIKQYLRDRRYLIRVPAWLQERGVRPPEILFFGDMD